MDQGGQPQSWHVSGICIELSPSPAMALADSRSHTGHSSDTISMDNPDVLAFLFAPNFVKIKTRNLSSIKALTFENARILLI